MLSSPPMQTSKHCQPEALSTRCYISSPMGAIIYNEINKINLGSGWHCFRWVGKHFLIAPMKSLRLGLLHDVNNMKLKFFNNIYSIIKLENKRMINQLFS